MKTNGTFVSATNVSAKAARVNVTVSVANLSADNQVVWVKNEIIAPNGKSLKLPDNRVFVDAHGEQDFIQPLTC
ncbi:hypothetical protein [Persicobacter psychrovividus]|uniref:hypothetical protein n=1 Tax=Persicobacter psychrovividus TaxID=387638 RepID=UPI0030CA4C7B